MVINIYFKLLVCKR